MLTLNQIPSHKSNKSPYELFKGQAIPLNFFHPIGNPVVVYSHRKKAKLDPRGELGRLIGFDAELKCYRILLNDGQILNTKNVDFLDFDNSPNPEIEHDELLVNEKMEHSEPRAADRPVEEEVNVKEEEVDEDVTQDEETVEFETADEDSEDDVLDVAESLVPAASNPVGRIL